MISIFSNFLGAILIGYFSFSKIAFLNVILFAFVWIIVRRMKLSLMTFQEYMLNKTKINVNKSSTLRHLLNILKSISKNRSYFLLLVQASMINGMLIILVSLTSIIFNINPATIISTYSFSVALFQGMISIGMIVAGLIVVKYSSKISIYKLVGSTYLLFIIELSMLIFNISFGIYCTAFFIGIFMGIISPKMSHMMYVTFSAESLGAIAGTVNFIYMLVPILCSFVFSIISSLNSLLPLYLLYLSIVVIGLILFISSKITNKESVKKSL